MFRPLLATELRLIRTACQPTTEQLKAVRTAGQAQLRAALEKYVDALMAWRQTGYQDAGRSPLPDVRKLFTAGLTDVVRQTLPAEQAERYQQNLKQRADARKHAALLCLVAKLDKDLLLSSRQRAELTDRLTVHWQEAWSRNMEMWQHRDQFIPTLPDEHVISILSPTQREVLERNAKVNVQGLRLERLRNHAAHGL